MLPFQQSFSPVCAHENGDSSDGGDGGKKCEAGQNNKPCKNKLGKRVLHGMRSLLKRHHTSEGEAFSTPADAWPKRVGDSVGGETDDLVLGTVLQSLRVLLSASDVDLALFFIDNLTVCGLFSAKISSWKREAYGKRVEEFVHIRSSEIGDELAAELLSITGPTQNGRRATAKGPALVAPSSVPAALPMMQFQQSVFSTSCSRGSTESVCTPGEQVPEWSMSARSRRTTSTSMAASEVSQVLGAGAPHDIVTEKTNPVRWRCQTSNPISPRSTSEMPSPEAGLSAVRRGRSNPLPVSRNTPQRNSHNHEQSTHSQPAQQQDGVCSLQLSAEQHPDFNHFLAAELQQYHVDRVLRLGRSAHLGERQHSA